MRVTASTAGLTAEIHRQSWLNPIQLAEVLQRVAHDIICGHTVEFDLSSLTGPAEGGDGSC